jgi:hypothetical protein
MSLSSGIFPQGLKSKLILFADDINVTFTDSNLKDLQNDIKIEFESLNEMNTDRTHFMQFTTKNSSQIYLDISYANKLISKSYDTKFLGIYVERILSWKIHVEKITHKVSAVCYTVTSVMPYM